LKITADDEALVRRFQTGDEEAFTLLARRWEQPVFHMAYRLLGRTEDADEVRQLALLRMHRGLAEFNGDARVSTWVYRIVANLCRDARRARESEVRRTRRVLSERIRTEAVPAEQHDVSDEGDRIGRAMMELPSEIRAVLVLRHYHDMTFIEIAEVLDLPPTTVRSRALAGMKQLAEALGFLNRPGSNGARGERT